LFLYYIQEIVTNYNGVTMVLRWCYRWFVGPTAKICRNYETTGIHYNILITYREAREAKVRQMGVKTTTKNMLHILPIKTLYQV
jgi:hypothetical protein